MAYSAEISRTNPSCFVFLIDQSFSMIDSWGVEDEARCKEEGVADAINRLLQNLVIRCSKEEGIRDYYHVGVIGYGQRVGPALGGRLAGRALVSISEIGNHPMKLETHRHKEKVTIAPETCPSCGAAIGCPTCGATIAPRTEVVDREIRLPIWFEPHAKGGTPMCQALTQAQTVVQEFLSRYKKCFPPIVINITDGEATDGNPKPVAKALREMKSKDGNVLLFNLHISTESAAAVLYPDRPDGLVDDYARMLFEMSSVLPDYIRTFAQQEGLPVKRTSRGFGFNADIVSVINFLDIGTRPSNLR